MSEYEFTRADGSTFREIVGHPHEVGNFMRMHGACRAVAIDPNRPLLDRPRNHPVYLHLFHGRDTIDQEMEDWGETGPAIGPLDYVHTTYGAEVKFACEPHIMHEFFPDVIKEWIEKGYSNALGPCDHHLSITEGMIEHQGKFYGDWSVSTSPST